MKPIAYALSLLTLALLLAGCEERTDQTDSGGILLEVEFVLFPVVVSVNQQDRVQIPTININSVVVAPNGATSLMDVEIDSMEVTFTRADAGSRLPPPFVQRLIGLVSAGGTLTYSNLNVMTLEQMRNPPLSDLLFANGGFDKETGANNIKLNLVVRFFGRTLAGRSVASVPRSLTIEFAQ